jgi:hypothetical protein
MTTVVATEIADRASRAMRDSLGDLIAIETRILASVDAWSTAVRDHPEAMAMVDRMVNVSKSHIEALARISEASARKRSSRASIQRRVVAIPTSASKALRKAAARALEAALACERAYQTARLSGDGDMCDQLESHLNDHAATVVEARRVLPPVVARELRNNGVMCTCRCPMCSIGACGCIRATLAAAEVAWGGDEPARTSGLILHSPPRSGSQLAAAGLGEGDLVLAVDGEEVGWNMEANAALRRHEPGEEARIEVMRRGGARTNLIVRRVG